MEGLAPEGSKFDARLWDSKLSETDEINNSLLWQISICGWSDAGSGFFELCGLTSNGTISSFKVGSSGAGIEAASNNYFQVMKWCIHPHTPSKDNLDSSVFILYSSSFSKKASR
ncbi:hypothetical protein MKW98_021088 [Papaver atlanticum]|uniref:Uncharacterized protein n=1 Tax=Papaver atlanticum TaxID=357466 RepID=A0AAD4T753_9MAGN|nr:hypothetical protein MKW98_021088 [Papaver atlanticum]